MRESARRDSSVPEKLASLAGVATVVLGSGAAAEAAIVAAQNVPIGPPATAGAQNDWDVDGAGTTDFTFENFTTIGGGAKAWIHERAGRFVATTGNVDGVGNLASNFEVDGTLPAGFNFRGAGQNSITVTSSSAIGADFSGNWGMGNTGFVGFKFTQGTDTFYGWAKLEIDTANAGTKGYGFQITEAYYNNTPGGSIRVGATADPAVPEPSAYALAMLAAGGVAAYRGRRKSPAA